MRLIDANEVEQVLAEEQACLESNDDRMWVAWVRRLLLTAPTVDAEPVRHGHWIDDDIGYGYFANCSECGLQIDVHENHGYFRYCPNCGAKMD